MVSRIISTCPECDLFLVSSSICKGKQRVLNIDFVTIKILERHDWNLSNSISRFIFMLFQFLKFDQSMINSLAMDELFV